MPKANNQADSALFVAFLALIAWAPIPLASDHIWSDSILIIGTLTIFMVWIAHYLRGNLKVQKSLIAAKLPLVCLITLQAWVAIQLLPLGLGTSLDSISIVPFEGLHKLFLGITLTLAFVMTLLLANSSQRIKTLCWVLILSGVFQASFGTLMALSGLEYTFFLEKPTGLNSNVGTMFYRNQQAGYLVLCLSVGIGLMISQINDKSSSWKSWLTQFFNTVVSSKGTLRICLIIMVAGLVMTRSRMGNSSFAIAMAIVGFLYIIFQKKSRLAGMIFLVSIVIVDVIVLSTFFDFEEVSNRIQQTDIATEGRAELNPLSWNFAATALPTGTGIASYYSGFTPFRDSSLDGLAMTHAHNDYLEFLTELGVPGAVILLIFGIYFLKRSCSIVIYGANKLDLGINFGALMALISIGIHSAVDYNLQTGAFPYSLLVLLAASIASGYTRNRQKTD